MRSRFEFCHALPLTPSAPLFTRLNLHTPHSCIQVKQFSICYRSLHRLESPLFQSVLVPRTSSWGFRHCLSLDMGPRQILRFLQHQKWPNELSAHVSHHDFVHRKSSHYSYLSLHGNQSQITLSHFASFQILVYLSVPNQAPDSTFVISTTPHPGYLSMITHTDSLPQVKRAFCWLRKNLLPCLVSTNVFDDFHPGRRGSVSLRRHDWTTRRHGQFEDSRHGCVCHRTSRVPCEIG